MGRYFVTTKIVIAVTADTEEKARDEAKKLVKANVPPIGVREFKITKVTKLLF